MHFNFNQGKIWPLQTAKAPNHGKLAVSVRKLVLCRVHHRMHINPPSNSKWVNTLPNVVPNPQTKEGEVYYKFVNICVANKTVKFPIVAGQDIVWH